MIKKTIKHDLQNVQSASSSFFTGMDDTLNNYLDPIVNGYSYIYWLELPSWFEKDDDLKYFKAMTQKNFRSFSGVEDINLETTSYQAGFAGNEVNVVTGVTRNNTEFTITHKEYSGGVMRKLYQKWISMVRDPRTGIALYPRLYNVDYGARNHTAKLMYIVVRPDVTNTNHNIVEYAALYSLVFPTNIPLGNLYNFEIGTQDSPSIDISFRGVPEIGPDVEEYAAKILKDKIMSTSADVPMLPVDSYNTYEDAGNHYKWGEGEGSLKNIYQTESDKK